VAEDHPSYRARIVGLLEALGLHVIAAEDGRLALKALEEHAGIRLLVTDLEMPHYTGFEVIEAWYRRGGAASAVIMVTGEADSLDVRSRCAAEGVRLIHKTGIAAYFEDAVREAVTRLTAGTLLDPTAD
jgi:two-component system, chemotaxis family, chemotaxis protein CheY